MSIETQKLTTFTVVEFKKAVPDNKTRCFDPFVGLWPRHSSAPCSSRHGFLAGKDKCRKQCTTFCRVPQDILVVRSCVMVMENGDEKMHGAGRHKARFAQPHVAVLTRSRLCDRYDGFDPKKAKKAKTSPVHSDMFDPASGELHRCVCDDFHRHNCIACAFT